MYQEFNPTYKFNRRNEMTKIEKRLFKKLLVLFIVLSTICLFSCTKLFIGFKVKTPYNISTESNLKSDDDKNTSCRAKRSSKTACPVSPCRPLNLGNLKR